VFECPVRQSTMQQMSSQNDTTALISAVIFGKSLKPSQRPTTPSTGQSSGMPDQRVQMPPVPQGSISTFHHTGPIGFPRIYATSKDSFLLSSPLFSLVFKRLRHRFHVHVACSIYKNATSPQSCASSLPLLESFIFLLPHQCLDLKLCLSSSCFTQQIYGHTVMNQDNKLGKHSLCSMHMSKRPAA
jgi:hypothetical protein